MKTEPEAKAVEPATKPASDPHKIELLDPWGLLTGVTLTLKDEPAPPEVPSEDETAEAARVRRLSKSVTSWTHLEVDGEAYPFSQARAAVLFTRFPHFADQVGKALKV